MARCISRFALFAAAVSALGGLYFPALADPPHSTLEKLAAAMAKVTEQLDAKAAAKLFAADADFVGPAGELGKGRDQIEKFLAETFRRFGPGGKLTPAMPTVRALGSDALVLDGTWEATGPIKGMPVKGRYTMILQKRDGAWEIVCARSMVPFEPAKELPK